MSWFGHQTERSRGLHHAMKDERFPTSLADRANGGNVVETTEFTSWRLEMPLKSQRSKLPTKGPIFGDPARRAKDEPWTRIALVEPRKTLAARSRRVSVALPEIPRLRPPAWRDK